MTRIYADFNGYGVDPETGRAGVPLDTCGSLCDLASAGIVLRDGVRLTIYSDADATEDLEADAEVHWDAEAGYWIAEFPREELRHVPTLNQWPPPLVCVRCGTPWDGSNLPPAAILEETSSDRPLAPGDVCAACGERIHRPIEPPKRNLGRADV